MSVNKVILVGNLGNDPEVRNFDNGGMVATVSIATSERWTDRNTGERKEHTEWHRVVFNNRLAEIASQYLRKVHRFMLRAVYAHASGRILRRVKSVIPQRFVRIICRCLAIVQVAIMAVMPIPKVVMPIQISNIKIRAIKADSIQILPINKPINLVVKIHQAIRSLSQTKPTQIQAIPKSEHLSLRVARWHKTMLLGSQHTLSKIQVCRLSKKPNTPSTNQPVITPSQGLIG